MSERVRFYLDEHIDLDIARALRRRRIDVLTAQKAEQCATDDRILLRTAYQQGRVFVTQDADALRLAAQGEPHAGIIYAPQGTPIGVILRSLLLIYDATDAEGMQQQIEYL
jgi:predicted nuclease of predicted toxin-antitoxin system